MHDCEDCCVFDARFSLYIYDALSVKRIQVDEVNALCNSVLFQRAIVVLNHSQHLCLRTGPQMRQVALAFDEVLKLPGIKLMALKNRFE